VPGARRLLRLTPRLLWQTVPGLIALGLGVAVAPCALGEQPKPAATMEWKLSTALGPAYAQGKAAEIWAALMRERSGGRLSVSLFPGATLAQRDPEREFAALRDGAIDLAVGSTTAWAVQVKELNVIALPWLVPDADALDALLHGDVAQRLAASVQAAGVVPLAWASDGFRELASQRAIHAPADLNGLTLRVAPTPLLDDTLLAMGARPASMSAASALAAQSSGSLDGEETSVGAYRTSRLYTTGLTHFLVWGAHAEALLFAVNRSVWDSLSDADRDLVRGAAQDAAVQATAFARKQAGLAALTELTRQGVTVTRLTPAGKQRFRDATREVYARWAALAGEDLVHAAEAVVAAPR
jgi:TRAP-type C4-dicarboxylate transport system substrate-binding protein